MAAELPKRLVPAIEQLAARLLDSRKTNTPLERLAADMLAGVHDLLMNAGLDGTLDTLAGGLAIEDASALADTPAAVTAVVDRLQTINLDGGGPRNAKPGQVASCVIGGLGLELVDEPDRSIAVGDDVRTEVTAAIASVVNEALALPKFRDSILSIARAQLAEPFHASFTKVAAQLDDRGLAFLKVAKVPIDALHAAQTAIADARTSLIERVAKTAIDRVKDTLLRSAPEVAARIDQPVSGRATVREVAIRRACDPRVTKTATHLVPNLVDSLTELARIAWRVAERAAVPYAASKTFAVGDVIEHPKFGRGTVASCNANRIDVQFAEQKVVLVHAPAKK